VADPGNRALLQEAADLLLPEHAASRHVSATPNMSGRISPKVSWFELLSRLAEPLLHQKGGWSSETLTAVRGPRCTDAHQVSRNGCTISLGYRGKYMPFDECAQSRRAPLICVME
jgi:hypothetical protein